MLLLAALLVPWATQAQITTFPYSNGFEGGLGGWTAYDTDNDTYGWDVDATAYYGTAHGGSSYLYSESYSDLDGSYEVLTPDNWLISPAITIGSGDNLELSWWVKTAAASYPSETYAVYIGTTGTVAALSATTPVYQHTMLATEDSWDQITVQLAAYAGQTIYIGFRHYNSSDMLALLIDDITISAAPTCIVPSAFAVDSLSSTQVYLSWTAGANETNWEVVVEGPTDTVVDYTSVEEYEASNLEVNTTYNFKVRAICGAGDTSAYAVLSGIRTPASEPINVFPYTCGFEYDADNDIDQASDWVLENGTQTNGWYAGNATNNGGSKALYISNDNGTSNAYTNTSTSNVWAYATFFLTQGQYALSFDWKGQAESCCDYLRVFLVPGSVELAAGSSTSPAGAVQFGGNLNQQSTWQTVNQTVEVTANGLYKLAFLWHNDGSVGTNPPAAIDNIVLSQLSCPSPTNLVVDSVASTQVYLSWTALGDETSWEVVVEGPTDTVVDYTSVEEYEALNLDPYTLYSFKVRAICGADDSSFYIALNSVRTLPSCPQPTHLTVDSVATTEIYLSWYAGGEESEWLVTVNDSAFSTTDNPLTLTDLSLNTLYTIGVSALCSSDDTSFVTSISTRTLAGEPISEFPYTCGFEIDADNEIDQASDWVLENGTQANGWYVGSATNNGGSKALYISNDNGTSNAYTNTSTSNVWAYATFYLTQGQYSLNFDWKAQAESCCDYIKAFLVPGTVELTAGSSSNPSGAVQFGGNMNQQSSWQSVNHTFDVTSDGLYKLAFLWHNDGSVGTNPPAAIDNISITQITCPSPANFTVDSIHAFEAFLSWMALGTESEWVVRTVSNGITSDWESVTGTPYTMTGLSSGTNYTFQLAAVCGDGDTSFIVSTTGTTPVTCPAPTGFTVSVDDTNAVADFTWTDATGSNWEFVYGPMGFNPFLASDDVQSTTTTTYQISNLDTGFFDAYVRTDCGGGDYSTWVGPLGFHYGVTVMNMATSGSDTIYTCAGIIYDDGGPSGTYSSSCQSTLVIYPSTPGADVVITGTSYTESTYDYIRIYDGVGTSGEELWNDYGVSATQNFGPFSSSAITVVFHSDGSVQYDGFQINVACTAPSSCPKPTPFVVNSVQTDSVNVSWRNPASVNNFELVIGAPGFLPDTVSDPITVTDTFYVFNNLQGGVAYQAYVRADCGDEYSLWAGPLNITPGLYVIGTSGTGSISMCGGVICDDGGLTGQYSNNADYQLTVYPSHPDSMLVFQGTAYTESSIDYLKIYEGVGTAGNLLWSTSSSSQQDVIPQTTVMSGPITLHFHSDGSVIYDGFALQVSCVAAPECAAVENLNVTAGPVSAIASWDEGYYGTYSGATVEYKPDTATEWTVLPMTTGTYQTIAGLTPNTDYNLRVAANCGGFDAAYAETNFTTTSFGCLVADPLTSHNDTVTGTATTSYNVPVNNFYRNTFSEQLYTSTDLGGSGTMVSFSLNYGYSSPMTSKTNCMVYMANTSVTSLDYNNYVDPATMTLVYSGSLNCTQGWNEFQLVNPFNYTGNNLVVAVIDNSNQYDGSSYVWNCHSESGKAFSWYSDSYTYPNGSMSKSNHSFRPNMVFNFLGCVQENTCAAPVAAVVDVNTTTVDVAWAPGNTETSWNVYYRQAGASNWSAPVNVTTNSYQFTNLNSGTNYEFKVEGVCDTQLLASTVSAATLCASISSLPYTEDFNSWGTGTLPNCWYNTGAYSPNSYSIISGSQNMTGATGGSVYMYSSSGSSISRIITPAIDTNAFQANQLQVVFNVKYTSTSYGAPSFTVGVMENPGDISTLVPVANVQHSGTVNSWEVFEVPLNNYTGNGSHIVIQTNYLGSYFYCYLDDLTIETIPTCPRPDSLAVSNVTSTSVDLSWHERGGASTWIVEYGPVGFDLGTGTTVVANSNPFTLAGLPVAYVGEYYVRSVCSSADTGDYSRVPCRFATSQIPATLPYLYTFENDTEWQNWQTASNVSNINWSRGNATASEGTYAMYISNDGGVSWVSEYDKVVNASVYRDFDFGSTPNNFEVTFRAKAGGCFGQSIYDGIYVIMVDPADPMEISNSSYTNPWGYMPTVNVYQDTVWDTYTLFFDSVSGIKRIAINWYNTNSQNNGTIVQGGGAIDSFAVVLPSCPRPTGLQVISTGGTNAQIAWDGEASGTYQVIYRPYPEGTSNTFVTVTGTQTTLTGLQSMTQYAFWVRRICGAGDTSSVGSGRLFTTGICDNGVTVTNFDTTMSTGTSSYSPIGYSTYNYSYTQTIIDSAQLVDLGAGAEITAMGFSTASTSAGNYFTNITVYLTNLPDSLGNLSSSFIHPSADLPFVKVVDNADFSYTTTGMQFHMFDTTFAWDGTSRILVSVVRNHGAWTSGSSFDAHTQTSGHMRYAYQDSGPYDYTTVTGGTASNTVGDIYLISCGAGCSAPGALTATNVTYNSATLNWSSNATDFEVSWKATTEATWSAPVAVTGATTYAVNGLVPETDYQFMVRAICDANEGLISDWTIGNFTTADLPCFEPTELQAVPSYTDATFNWTAGGQETQWTLHVWNSTFDQEYTVNAKPYTVTGLTQSVTYNAAVKAVCGNGAAESEYSDTISFTTVTCAVVTGVTATATSSTTATVSWTPTGASVYEVNYGNRGFQQGGGRTITVNDATTCTITDLEPASNYDIYVRALCETGVYGGWSSVAQITTPDQEGISTADGMNISIYPNPTTSSTTVALSGVAGEVAITIVDMNGRVVMSDSMSCEGDCTKTLEVTGLAQGAYFVRISGENVNMVKKLVVK